MVENDSEKKLLHYCPLQNPILYSPGMIPVLKQVYSKISGHHSPRETFADLSDQLNDACYCGNVKWASLIVKKLEQGFEIETPALNCGLAWACQGGQRNTACLMIKHGANDLSSGLRAACRVGKLDLVRLMVEHGANNWIEALYLACHCGHDEILSFLFGLDEMRQVLSKLKNNPLYQNLLWYSRSEKAALLLVEHDAFNLGLFEDRDREYPPSVLCRAILYGAPVNLIRDKKLLVFALNQGLRPEIFKALPFFRNVKQRRTRVLKWVHECLKQYLIHDVIKHVVLAYVEYD